VILQAQSACKITAWNEKCTSGMLPAVVSHKLYIAQMKAAVKGAGGTSLANLLDRIEKVVLVTTLLLMTGGPLLVILTDGYNEGDQSPLALEFAVIQYFFTFLYFVIFLYILPNWRQAIYLLFREKWVMLLILMSIASIGWTYAPDVTPRRLIGLVGTTMVGVYLAARYDLHQQMKILSYTFCVAIAMSFLFVIAIPKYGVMGGLHVGDWRGIYFHKNVLGKIMNLALCVFWLRLQAAKGIHQRSERRSLLMWTGAASFLLLMTTSSSSIANAIFLWIASLVIAIFKLRPRTMIPSVSILVLIAASISVLLTLNAEFLVGVFFGKNLTFSGRTSIWDSVLRMISQDLWIGYGYSGFWNGALSPAAEVWRDNRWKVPHSHNGPLDLLLDLGLIGLGLFCLSFRKFVSKSLGWLRSSDAADHMWPMIFVIYFFLVNTTETSLLSQNNIYWVVFVSISLSMHVPRRGMVRESSDSSALETSSGLSRIN
jgi:exopolysaccharide production protein ExoQ